MIIADAIKGLNPTELKEFLHSNATSIEEGTYFKNFNEQERQVTQGEFSDLSLNLLRKERELEEIKAKFKAEIKPMKQERDELLSQISHNGEHLEGKLYLFDNQETGMMESYNEMGELISTRRLKPEERQLRLQINKTA